jgi:Zn-dependent protease with chaperone function
MAGKTGACPRCRGHIVISASTQTSPPKRADATPVKKPAAKPVAKSRPSPPAAPVTAVEEGPILAETVRPVTAPPADSRAEIPQHARPDSQSATPGSQGAMRSMEMPTDPLAKLTPAQIQHTRNLVVAAVKGKRVPSLIKADEYRSGVITLYAVLIGIPLVLLSLFVALSVALFLVTGPCGLVFIVIVGGLMLLLLGASALPALLSSSSGPRGCRKLTREGEPFLYQFVEHLCLMLGAPPPERIQVDCEINASASMGDRGLILTLGLPLIAGLNLNQFVGVLSHEIGHFTQSEGMQSLSFFQKFQHWAVFVFHSGQDLGLFWSANRLLLILMLRVVLIFVGRLCQRMEFDADRYESLMVGTKVFESTCYSLQYLGAGYERSIKTLRTFARQKKLGDNLPKLIAINARKLPDEVREEIRLKIQSNEQAGLTDSHPPDSQRIARVQAEQQAGVFHVPAPTTALFNDFDQLCKNVTWDVYRKWFGANFSPQQMHSMDELVEQRQAVEDKTEKADERFAGIFHPLRPIRNTEVFLDEFCDIASRQEVLKQSRDQLAQIQANYFEARNQFDQADKEILDAEEGIAGLTCSMHYTHDQAVITQSRNRAMQAKNMAEQKIRALQSTLVGAEELQGARVMAALDLLAANAVDAGDNEALCDRAVDVLFGMHAIKKCLDDALHLRFLLIGQRSALGHLREGEVPPPIVSLVMDTNGRLHTLMAKMKQHLEAANYPLGDGKNSVSLGGFLGVHRFGNQHLGVMDNPFELCEDLGEFLDEFYLVYRELTAHLAELVERVEIGLGLPPLPKPALKRKK